jgi:hypothetical protein
MNATQESWVEIVRRKVAHMRYGSVQVIVHDGRVTQVEATEKTRLSNELSSDRHEPEANIHGSSHRNSGAGA